MERQDGMNPIELEAERAYTARVRALLEALITQSEALAGSHTESIRAILADAWDELRVRPTALSPSELRQLSADVDRFTARRQLASETSERARRMLDEPFFARVDFAEVGTSAPERIVIGLYSLADEDENLLVHDWRAPICSLYYDAEPGPASYACPSGVISGTMTLKRQYRMERGELKFYVDTHLSIDDEMLLDMLSGSASGHMRQIVSTIQAEQNAAIRSEGARVVSVVGGAGSGKTSVAMHRAAYLMYRRRDVLDAAKIEILSPGTAFSEYISTVLPELGEENIRARTLHEIVESVLGRKVESPVRQLDRLLEEDVELRVRSVANKCDLSFYHLLEREACRFDRLGPAFSDVEFEGETLVRAEELSAMYARELSLLTPAQRLTRMAASLETRFADWENVLYRHYERALEDRYSGRALVNACRMAVAQRLQSVRAQLQSMLRPDAGALYRPALAELPKALRDAFDENCGAGIVWWEDAVAQAYLLVRLGFAEPDKRIVHLLVDEAQDYSETALALLHAYHPAAEVTLLGDPMQRTCPGMPPCDPAGWGACFGAPDAPVFRLSRCYRSALPIARLCESLLPGEANLNPIGREGEPAVVAEYSDALLRRTLERFRKEGYRSIAVLTRTRAQAAELAGRLENVYLLDGDDLTYEVEDNVVACYHLVKGMEFDAVAVVWPDCEDTAGERRRLYTACSRALHAVALCKGYRSAQP